MRAWCIHMADSTSFARFEPSEFHTEAQAVMMAESVLGLDADPKQAPLVQVPRRAALDTMETQDGHGSFKRRDTHQKKN